VEKNMLKTMLTRIDDCHRNGEEHSVFEAQNADPGHGCFPDNNSFFLKLTAATISMRRDMLQSILISPSVSATADLYLLLKMQQTKKAEQHDQSHTTETSTIPPDFFVDVEVIVAVDEVV
jgi:hypothetical protein